jgi:hypothetical protein
MFDDATTQWRRRPGDRRSRWRCPFPNDRIEESIECLEAWQGLEDALTDRGTSTVAWVGQVPSHLARCTPSRNLGVYIRPPQELGDTANEGRHDEHQVVLPACDNWPISFDLTSLIRKLLHSPMFWKPVGAAETRMMVVTNSPDTDIATPFGRTGN